MGVVVVVDKLKSLYGKLGYYTKLINEASKIIKEIEEKKGRKKDEVIIVTKEDGEVYEILSKLVMLPLEILRVREELRRIGGE
jgi:hypothetical protein